MAVTTYITTSDASAVTRKVAASDRSGGDTSDWDTAVAAFTGSSASVSGTEPAVIGGGFF